VPVQPFDITFVELRDLRDNKIKEVPTNSHYINVEKKYKEVVFTTDLNLTELVLNGYSGSGKFTDKDKKSGTCILFDETKDIGKEHISLQDLALKFKHEIAQYLKLTDTAQKYTYSCVLDTNNFRGEKISFHVELAYFATYTKYVSKPVEVDIL
jgi:hypothetical protein